MKTITKTLATIALTITMLFVSTPVAKADLFGIGDEALLTQQIAQFIQDLTMFEANWNDLASKIDKVKDIANTISKGKKVYTTISTITDKSKKMIRTGRDLERYWKYIKAFGDDFRIDRSYYIYRTFMSETQNILAETSATLTEISTLFGSSNSNGADAIRVMDNVQKTFCTYVQGIENKANVTMNNLVHEVAKKKNAKADQDFRALPIYS